MARYARMAPPVSGVATIQPTRTRLASTPKYSARPPETPKTCLSVEERVRGLGEEVVFMHLLSPSVASRTIGDDPEEPLDVPPFDLGGGDCGRGGGERLGAQAGRVL